MPLGRMIWLLVPLVGLAELAAHAYFSRRAPDLKDWQAVAPRVAQLKKAEDLLVIAPTWAEPLARQTLGEESMPVSEVARADATGYRSALELGLLGQHAPELSDWRELERQVYGGFLLRRLENPRYERTLYAFNDHVRPGQLFVVEWNGEAEHSCEFTERARVSAGGLGGHVTYPRERYRCLGGESFFVGVTVIDDQNYRPRRCIFAHPPLNAALHLRFPAVPAGKKIRGYAGESYLIARDDGVPVEFAVFVDAQEIGRQLFEGRRGFAEFEYATPPQTGQAVEVTFQIQSREPMEREFCFAAEMR